MLPLVQCRSSCFSQTCACVRATSQCPSAWLLKGLTLNVRLCCFQLRIGTAPAPLKNCDDVSFPVLTWQGEFSAPNPTVGFKTHLSCPRKTPNQPCCSGSWVRELLQGIMSLAERMAKATRLWMKSWRSRRCSCSVHSPSSGKTWTVLQRMALLLITCAFKCVSNSLPLLSVCPVCRRLPAGWFRASNKIGKSLKEQADQEMYCYGSLVQYREGFSLLRLISLNESNLFVDAHANYFYYLSKFLNIPFGSLAGN